MNRRVMKTLIVDDEPIARRVLREELETVADVVVVGEAENGKQALQQISALQPDLVLLDLQMPVMGGFEVVRRLSGGHMPAVVIVTAFDQHAIQAFEAGAVDYLLKPVSDERLRKAVERARKRCEDPLELAHDVARIAAAETHKIVGRNGEEYVLLDPDEILAFHTGRSKEDIHRDTERDRILGAKEAVEYGLADRVMLRRRPGPEAAPTPIR